MDALLIAVEVDRAVDLRGDQPLLSAPAKPDRLADSANARAREPDLHLGRRRLEVVEQLA